ARSLAERKLIRVFAVGAIRARGIPVVGVSDGRFRGGTSTEAGNRGGAGFVWVFQYSTGVEPASAKPVAGRTETIGRVFARRGRKISRSAGIGSRRHGGGQPGWSDRAGERANRTVVRLFARRVAGKV